MPALASDAPSYPLKQIDAGVLNVSYAEAGPATGPAVILLHGWPYDIHAFDDVAPILAARGYRVIIPFLRFYGSTRFRSTETIRNGQQTAVAADTIALMDALRIEKAILAGFDWGSRTATIIAALWPERCSGLVAVSGYVVVDLEQNQKPLSPEGRARLVVPVLLRHRTRSARLRGEPVRVQQVDLAARLTETTVSATTSLRRRRRRSRRRASM